MEGIASYYADDFNGKKTANGEIYDMYKMTAAHRSLPFNTKVRVTNLDNKRSIVVRINDRGPFKLERLIDLSLAAATQLGMKGTGTARVRLEVLEWGDEEYSK
jgi:rare lipoprotein A